MYLIHMTFACKETLADALSREATLQMAKVVSVEEYSIVFQVPNRIRVALMVAECAWYPHCTVTQVPNTGEHHAI